MPRYNHAPPLLTALFVVLFAPLQVQAQCVTPLDNPSGAPNSSWADVLTARASASLNSVISEIQDINTTGTGDVNLDFYALTFDSNGRSLQEWLLDFREHLNSYIYTGTSYSVGPVDERSRDVWLSPNPLGAVLIFNLSQVFGVSLMRGGVVVSCADPTSFIFLRLAFTES